MSTPTVTASRSRRGLMRWAVAATATAALVVSGSGLVVFAQSGTGESQGPQFASADAVAYVEARLDMPAGQGDAVAQLMTAFPGFADPGSFDLKKDELFAMLTAQLGAAAPEGDLIGDVFTGEIGIALANIESAMMGEDPSLVAGLALADAEAAGDLVEQLLAGASADSVTESSYNDVAIFSDPMSSQPMNVALHADWLLMGLGEGTVEGAIDVLDGAVPSLAENAAFTAAWARLPESRLAGAWMDLAPFATFLDFASMMAEGETGVALPTDDLAAMLPTDLIASLAAENDRLTLEVLVTPGEGTPTMPVGESELAMSFPAETQLYVETRELGAAVGSGLGQLATLMESEAMGSAGDTMGGISDIEVLFGEDSPITAMLGVPLPVFLDFVGDAAVGAGFSSDGVWAGIAAEIGDDAAATERTSNLLTVLRMLTMEQEGISLETADVEGVEVTTINVPLDAMMAESGLPLDIANGIDVAIADGTLLIGLGDFVESAILSDGTDSLGASAGYVDALGDDTVNAGVLYLNISSLLTALDPMLSMMAPEWSQIAPYATGFDRMIAVGTADDEVIGSRMTVIVGQ